MNLYLKKINNCPAYQSNIIDWINLQQSELKNHQIFNIGTDPFVEDCLILIQLMWRKIRTEQASDSLKKIKNKKIMIINHGYSFSNKDGLIMLKELTKWLNDAEFNPTNVYIFCQFQSEVDLIQQYIPGAKVHAIDEWLVEFLNSNDICTRLTQTDITNKNLPTKKFSIFSRRYTEDRFNFFIDLITRNVIDNCLFTFTNKHGENLIETIDIDDLKANIPEDLLYSRHNIENWIDGMPYETGNDLLDPNINEINNMLDNSKINIVYETDPIKGPSMISEKTYKAMFFKKPFIIMCHQHTLKLLKDCGYKTFSPWINESYDDIEDYQERKVAVLNEIERLNSLSDDDLDLLISQCNDIVEHNYNWMFSQYNASLICPENFKISNMTFLKTENKDECIFI
jgi:hypothetical protein